MPSTDQLPQCSLFEVSLSIHVPRKSFIIGVTSRIPMTLQLEAMALYMPCTWWRLAQIVSQNSSSFKWEKLGKVATSPSKRDQRKQLQYLSYDIRCLECLIMYIRMRTMFNWKAQYCYWFYRDLLSKQKCFYKPLYIIPNTLKLLYHSLITTKIMNFKRI